MTLIPTNATVPPKESIDSESQQIQESMNWKGRTYTVISDPLGTKLVISGASCSLISTCCMISGIIFESCSNTEIAKVFFYTGLALAGGGVSSLLVIGGRLIYQLN